MVSSFFFIISFTTNLFPHILYILVQFCSNIMQTKKQEEEEEEEEEKWKLQSWKDSIGKKELQTKQIAYLNELLYFTMFKPISNEYLYWEKNVIIGFKTYVWDNYHQLLL